MICNLETAVRFHQKAHIKYIIPRVMGKAGIRSMGPNYWPINFHILLAECNNRVYIKKNIP